MLDGKKSIQQADVMSNTGFLVIESIAEEKAKEKAGDGDPQEVKMAASNRLYEEKLIKM